MSDFIIGMAPVFACWAIPLVPVFYGVIVENFDTSRGHRQPVPTRATTVRKTAPLGATNRSIAAMIEEPGI